MSLGHPKTPLSPPLQIKRMNFNYFFVLAKSFPLSGFRKNFFSPQQETECGGGNDERIIRVKHKGIGVYFLCSSQGLANQNLFK